jgi:hypothetical protein
LLEIFKLAGVILFGGVAGALINEWFRRQKEKTQTVSLIERVNRSVSPGLDGVFLAKQDPKTGLLALLQNLHEYQLTLRNTSSLNLKDVEVQFDFSADDVESYASRPSLSKTALVAVEANAGMAEEKRFRWRIPHLPAGDSVEFTFRSINPKSVEYEVALYNTDSVVIEKIVGEPAPKQNVARNVGAWIAMGAACCLLVFILFLVVTGRLVGSSGEKFSNVEQADCSLRIVSLYDQYGQQLRSPWRIKDRIFNAGAFPCVIEAPDIEPKGSFTVAVGEVFEKEWIVEQVPVAKSVPITVHGRPNETASISVPIYTEQPK